MSAMVVIAGAGWAGVFVVAGIAHGWLGWLTGIMIGFFAVGTLVLLRQPWFPRRAEAIATSWMGPALAIVGDAISRLCRLSASGDASAGRVVEMLWFVLAAVACLVLYSLWLLRYGVLHMVAMTTAVWTRERERLKQQKDVFPPYWRWVWWIPAALIALGYGAMALLVLSVMRQ